MASRVAVQHGAIGSVSACEDKRRGRAVVKRAVANGITNANGSSWPQ